MLTDLPIEKSCFFIHLPVFYEFSNERRLADFLSQLCFNGSADALRVSVYPFCFVKPSNPTRKITIIKESWTRTGWLDYWANISLTSVLE